MKVKIPDTNQNIKVGPDFEKAIRICDHKYGKDTEESELCFQDYRDFFNVKVKIDLDGIVEYCSNRYELEEDIIECEENIVNLTKEQL